MNYQDLLEVINALVQEIERKTCTHEETHRGGILWEVCDACGAKWADDEGGKPEFKWSAAVIKARELLDKPVPQIPWVRVLDEEMVSTHQGVALGDDSYAEAKKKLSMIINWHVDVATDPAVNGGYKLMPVEPTQEMIDHVIDERLDALVAGKEHTFIDIYTAMIAAANPGAQTKGEEK